MEALSAEASIDLQAGRGHTTGWSDLGDFAKYAWPLIPDSGYSSASDITSSDYADLTFQTDGYYYMFDQRSYLTPEEFADAALRLDGWLYVPS
jgi:hypothetical protein